MVNAGTPHDATPYDGSGGDADSRPDPEQHYRRRQDVRYRLVDGEAVVLRQAAGETLVLNEVGSRILELLDRGEPISAVPVFLRDEFEAESIDVEEDVYSFVSDLVAIGVIEPVVS
jgi:Coenzyme PQQ synthesis protein D (PqqD)